MKNEYRKVVIGQEARERILKGVNIVGDLIASTMGHGGRNVLIEQKGRVHVTNDGFNIAKNIILEDEIEDLGAKAIINGSVITNSMVGDGTTATIVIAQALIKQIFKQLEKEENLAGGKSNVMKFKRQIEEDKNKALQMLQKGAKDVKTLEDLEKVAITSLENEEWGKTVADIAWKVGKDGYIGVDENFSNKTETEVVDGMKIHGTYISDLLSTNPRMEAILPFYGNPAKTFGGDEPLIIVTTAVIDDQEDLAKLCNQVMKKCGKKNVVLIAKNYDSSSEVERFCKKNIENKVFYLLAIKVPALEDSEIKDLALFTGGKCFEDIKDVKFVKEDLGVAKKVVVNNDHFFLIGGKGNKTDIKARIKDLREEQKAEPVEDFRNKITQRIASLSSGVGIIKVATNTNVETRYLKDKFEDAVCACKAALEEGIVKGGGQALYEIADKMPDSILFNALQSCKLQIQENAGEEKAIGENIVDPVKVLRIALENACSIAGVIITTNGGIAEKRESIDLESFTEALKPKDK